MRGWRKNPAVWRGGAEHLIARAYKSAAILILIDLYRRARGIIGADLRRFNSVFCFGAALESERADLRDDSVPLGSCRRYGAVAVRPAHNVIFIG